MTNQTFQSENWQTLVNNIRNSLGLSFKYSEADEAVYIDGLYMELNSDAEALVSFCEEALELVGEFEEVWPSIKAAAVIVTRMGQGHLSTEGAPETLYDSVIPVLWRAAERCGIESWETLGHGRDDGWVNWQKHKMPLDSIFFAVANVEDPHGRMERFFNSSISTYWKSFFIDWDILWHRTTPDEYLSTGGHRVNHKIQYYDLLIYRLTNFETQFELHAHKTQGGLELLTQNPDNIPTDRSLRKRIYEALSFYLQEKQYENTHIFNEIFAVLKHDTIGFILSDPHYQAQQQEAGKVLLSASGILEQTWDTNNRLQREMLPAILAAMDHNDAHIQRKAKEFLKTRAPTEIQQRLERLIDHLDSESNPEEVSNLISNLIEFGSQVAIKTVLKKCVIWIASDENWPLIERAAQKLRLTPSAVQPLVDQLNSPQEDKRVRVIIKEKVIADQDHFVFHELYDHGSNNADQFGEKAYDRFQKLEAAQQPKYLEDLEQWCLHLEERSKNYADHIALWREAVKVGEKSSRPKETVELTDKLLGLLTREKIDEHNHRVQRWITSLLSQMSDFRFFEDEPETAKSVTQALEKFAIDPLSKRLPNEDDLDIRENIVRILGNVGGPAAVDALVRTVSGKERERKARQALLSEYYLEPSKERSEEAAALLNDAVENAKRTMRLLQVLNAATFVLGAILILGGVAIAIVSEELASRFIGFFSGLGGVGAIVTIFLKDPLKRIQNAMGDLVQIQTAFTGFVWDLNLNGTYIQSQYVAEGILTDYDIRQTTNRIAASIDKTMNLIQVYAEGEYDEKLTRLSYILPQTDPDSNTIALFGEHLRGKPSNGKKITYQVAINHNPVNIPIEMWNNNVVIFELSPQTIADFNVIESDSPRLWISLFIGEAETNALPFTPHPEASKLHGAVDLIDETRGYLADTLGG